MKWYASWADAQGVVSKLSDDEKVRLSERSVKLEDRVHELLKQQMVSRVLQGVVNKDYVNGYRDALTAYRNLVNR
jgi:hypothetical protein